MKVAWSHCPLCELKQVASFPSTATTLCWGTRPPPTHTATYNLSSAPGTLPPTPLASHTTHPCTDVYIAGDLGGCMGRGGAEEEQLCFASSPLCSPTAPPGSQPVKLQAPLAPAGVLPGLKRCGRAGTGGSCPVRATVGRKFQGFLLFLFANS
ncbi:hypothetical protein mRhiFer1_009143 [Rhinolophus ferrumequinum]|uniref:Uncharacterized protein n=1 Tax=Rhinolophus ferrumequinum TaxID=59479 RepID=A0A7J7SJ84_RHIFE|nr:hypothetical protein mRhiFer1_009143 [Rhinolophus ferrumequinum]